MNQSRVYEAPIGGILVGLAVLHMACLLNVVVDYRAIERHGNLQMLDLGRPIEKLPVLVCFDFIVPANTGDGVTGALEMHC